MRSSITFRTAGILCLLAGIAAVGIADDKAWTAPPESKELKNPMEATPQVLAAAKELYDDKCANCHGDKGKGDGPEAEMYDTPPADLTQPGFLDKMTDGEIFWKISQGRRPMPSFRKQYTDEQRWQLVHFVRSLVPKPPAKKSEAKKP